MASSRQPARRDSDRFRLTPQRLAVLDAVRASPDHPDAARIYEVTRRGLPRISLGTVYRALAKLRDTGYVRELPQASGAARYDAKLDRHAHVNCTRCGSVVDVEVAGVDAIREQARRASGFPRLDGERVEFYGRCLVCDA